MGTTSTTVKTKGKQIDSVLDGQVRLELGNNRLVVADANGIIRMIIGVLPDGDIGIVITKEGVNALDVFN